VGRGLAEVHLSCECEAGEKHSDCEDQHAHRQHTVREEVGAAVGHVGVVRLGRVDQEVDGVADLVVGGGRCGARVSAQGKLEATGFDAEPRVRHSS